MPVQMFEAAVIGGGPGGYVCALRAAQNGLKTALIEMGHLGGTCLNAGCVPSKALLHSTEQYRFLAADAANHGIIVSDLAMDLDTLMQRKDKAVEGLRKGIETLCQRRGVEIIQGRGRLLGKGRIGVNDLEIEAGHIVIATGSKTAELSFLPFDGENIISSDEALSLNKIPSRLVVVGAGPIGLELGSVWSRLGSEVTVTEFLPQIAPAFDEDVARAAQRAFKKQGLKIEVDTPAVNWRKQKKRVILLAEKKRRETEFPADKILVAAGRVPYHEGLGLEKAGVELDEKNRIKTGRNFRAAPGVYAIGDAAAGPMLAHKAEEEGIALADIIAGKYGGVNYDVIPDVIYTWPEMARAGMTERTAKEKGLEVKTGVFPLAANARAAAAGERDGMVKVVARAGDDQLLGVQTVSPHASEMIGEAVAHLEYGGSAEDLARTVHAHPAYAEALREAALAASGLPLHSI